MKKKLSGTTTAVVILVTLGAVFAVLYRLSEAPTSDRIGPNFGAAAANYEGRAKPDTGQLPGEPTQAGNTPPPGPGKSSAK